MGWREPLSLPLSQDFSLKRSLLDNRKSIWSQIAAGDSHNNGLRFEHKHDFHDVGPGFQEMEKIESCPQRTRKWIFWKKLFFTIKIIIFGFCGALKHPQGRSRSIVWIFSIIWPSGRTVHSVPKGGKNSFLMGGFRSND